MKKENITSSITQTRKLAEKIAQKIIKKGLEGQAFVIGLKGNLGGGKTTFVQGFAKGFGIKEKILSPTFVIYKKFQSSKDLNFYHFDCYRINNPKEIFELGFKKIISNPKNIVAIEWPEKIYPVEFVEGDVLRKAKRFNRGKKVLPKKMIKLNFRFIDKNKREIIF